MKIRIYIGLLSILLFLIIAETAQAQKTVEEATGYLNHEFSFKVNNESWIPKDTDGKELAPIIFKDRTYVPFRAISNALGSTVDWNGDTQTISLDFKSNGNSNVLNTPLPAQPDSMKANLGFEKIVISMDHRISFKVNNETWIPKDEGGNVLFAINYQNRVYIPLRAIGEATGSKVEWNGDLKLISLTKAIEVFIDDAIIRDNKTALRMLINGDNSLQVNPITGKHPLELAIEGGKTDVISLLLSKLEDINGVLPSGFTPLTYAIYQKQTLIVQQILIADANVLVEDSKGNTPLQLASKLDSLEIVSTLLMRNKLISNFPFYKDGMSPLFYAITNNNSELVEYLLRYNGFYNLQLKNEQGLNALSLIGNGDIHKDVIETVKVSMLTTAKLNKDLKRTTLIHFFDESIRFTLDHYAVQDNQLTAIFSVVNHSAETYKISLSPGIMNVRRLDKDDNKPSIGAPINCDRKSHIETSSEILYPGKVYTNYKIVFDNEAEFNGCMQKIKDIETDSETYRNTHTLGGNKISFIPAVNGSLEKMEIAPQADLMFVIYSHLGDDEKTKTIKGEFTINDKIAVPFELSFDVSEPLPITPYELILKNGNFQ